MRVQAATLGKRAAADRRKRKRGAGVAEAVQKHGSGRRRRGLVVLPTGVAREASGPDALQVLRNAQKLQRPN